ncbi:hypothetical protein [Pseudaminobacter soli (ex Li et al. 2025)]|uniref:Curlin n=1 Tax=Pseudaminobacter soli (ex Li et al. 2025) TaxID=1295366 RepID=A0A2P7SES0_9HYPH|nr:hypothetical protein [Mesorhizobium soli]PSJ60811.1 hypothetical protein C7I85_12275 [Mesorhizobium soli]
MMIGRAVKVAKALATGAALLVLSAGSGSAQQFETLTFETNQADVNALIEPIRPLIAGNAQSTTSITQIGEMNQANSGIVGRGSLSVIQQSGSNNRAVQSIEGNNSALLLVQGGTNNNVLQASRGDRNFQLVGVSGNNNDVAYIQAGNDLAGALDVRDSQNSTVLALQTAQSGRYLMPSGLRGLENKIVVVVPGRMYVLNK